MRASSASRAFLKVLEIDEQVAVVPHEAAQRPVVAGHPGDQRLVEALDPLAQLVGGALPHRRIVRLDKDERGAERAHPLLDLLQVAHRLG